jgi:rhodanese-related sulfurtransferase
MRSMATRIEYPELRELLDRDTTQVVEVLPQGEYDEEHLPGAVNIPLKTLDAQTTDQLDKRNPVVVYCWDYL